MATRATCRQSKAVPWRPPLRTGLPRHPHMRPRLPRLLTAALALLLHTAMIDGSTATPAASQNLQDRYIVTLRNTPPAQMIASHDDLGKRIRDAGGAVLDKFDIGGTVNAASGADVSTAAVEGFHGFSAVIPSPDLVKALKADPRVEDVEQDQPVHIASHADAGTVGLA